MDDLGSPWLESQVVIVSISAGKETHSLHEAGYRPQSTFHSHLCSYCVTELILQKDLIASLLYSC